MAMLQTTIPEGYKTKLNLYDTQNAIALIKATFQEALSGVLNLKRVSAPLFVYPDTAWNALYALMRPQQGGMQRLCIRWQNGSVMR